MRASVLGAAATTAAMLVVVTEPALAGEVVINVGPGQSIQAAISGASDGQTILVAPGTYHEAINFMGKAVTLRSSGGADVTVIDGSGLNTSVVTFDSGEGLDSVLDGFTITGGTGTGAYTKIGGGIFVDVTSPTIANCVLTGNTASGGGGAYLAGSSGVLTNCRFEGNQTTGSDTNAGGGAGLLVGSGAPVITGCVFRGNMAAGYGGGGGMSIVTGFASVSSCLFVDNGAYFAGGMRIHGAWCEIANCTFSENTAATFGGAVRTTGATLTPVPLTNCILWGNSATYGGQQIIDQAGGQSTLDSCTVQGGWSGNGANNSAADPMFMSALGGDFRLLPGSPCIDSGANAAVSSEVDLAGLPRIVNGMVDRGAYEVQEPAPACPADLNGTGLVDVLDLVMMVLDWGATGSPADLDGDGVVGTADLSALAQQWGPCQG
jgi:predicted outer membrane repeat protein